MMAQVLKCITNVGEHQKQNHVLKIDQTIHNGLTTQIFYSDFGAMLDLCASEKYNSSVSNHVVICVFFCYSIGDMLTF